MASLPESPSLLQILALLPHRDILNCMSLCRRLYDITRRNPRHMAKGLIDCRILFGYWFENANHASTPRIRLSCMVRPTCQCFHVTFEDYGIVKYIVKNTEASCTVYRIQKFCENNLTNADVVSCAKQIMRMIMEMFDFSDFSIGYSDYNQIPEEFLDSLIESATLTRSRITRNTTCRSPLEYKLCQALSARDITYYIQANHGEDYLDQLDTSVATICVQLRYADNADSAIENLSRILKEWEQEQRVIRDLSIVFPRNTDTCTREVVSDMLSDFTWEPMSQYSNAEYRLKCPSNGNNQLLLFLVKAGIRKLVIQKID